MILHVLFTEDGIPGWIGDTPREGSEPVEGLTVAFLAAHRRLPSGEWEPRPPQPAEPAEPVVAEEPVVDPDWIEQEVARRALPDLVLRNTGRITVAEFARRVDTIRAGVVGRDNGAV